MKAVGRRYSGTFRDENDSRAALPRVSFWSLWNEPNQGGWLTPQWSGGKAASPAALPQALPAGHKALVATGHGAGRDPRRRDRAAGRRRGDRDVADVPEAASSARSSTGGTRGSEASRDWHAHHPYTKDLAPTERDKSTRRRSRWPTSPTSASCSTRSRRRRTAIRGGPAAHLDRVRLRDEPAGPVPQTTLDQQAQFNQFGDYLAFANPRVDRPDAVPPARRPAAEALQADVQAVLVHLPVGPVHDRRPAEARGPDLLVPLPRGADGRGDPRVLGPAALPPQRPARRTPSTASSCSSSPRTARRTGRTTVTRSS